MSGLDPVDALKRADASSSLFWKPAVSPEQITAAQQAREEALSALRNQGGTDPNAVMASSLAAALPMLLGYAIGGKRLAGAGAEGTQLAMKNAQSQWEAEGSRNDKINSLLYSKQEQDYQNLLNKQIQDQQKRQEIIKSLFGTEMENKRFSIAQGNEMAKHAANLSQAKELADLRMKQEASLAKENREAADIRAANQNMWGVVNQESREQSAKEQRDATMDQRQKEEKRRLDSLSLNIQKDIRDQMSKAFGEPSKYVPKFDSLALMEQLIKDPNSIKDMAAVKTAAGMLEPGKLTDWDVQIILPDSVIKRYTEAKNFLMASASPVLPDEHRKAFEDYVSAIRQQTNKKIQLVRDGIYQQKEFTGLPPEQFDAVVSSWFKSNLGADINRGTSESASEPDVIADKEGWKEWYKQQRRMGNGTAK